MDPKPPSETKAVPDADDRVMKDVVAPPRFPLSRKDLFPDGGSKVMSVAASLLCDSIRQLRRVCF